jgi:hypothetical protein
MQDRHGKTAFIRWKTFFTSKSKVFPLQAWAGAWRSGRLRLPDFLDFRYYEGGKVVTLTHRPSLPAGVSWYSFLEAESTPRHMIPSVATEKIPPATPLGIDPETLRLAAQCLNHYATPGPERYGIFREFTILTKLNSVQLHGKFQ